MKFPVGQIIRASYETIGQHGRRFLVVAFILAIILLSLTELVWTFAVDATDDLALLSLVDGFSWTLIAPFVTAPVEVHWLRILLLREEHRASDYFRFRLRELRYASVSLLTWVCVAVPYLLASEPLIQPSFLADASQSMPLVIYGGTAVASIALSTLLAAWLSPVLAAIAVDRGRQRAPGIFRVTRGHRVHIGLVFLFSYEVLKIPMVPFELLFGDSLYGFGFLNIVYLTYTAWLLFCYVAVTAEVYWELDSDRQVRDLGSVFD